MRLKVDVSVAKGMSALEEQNAKLKKLLANTMLDVSTLGEMLGTEARELNRSE
ncbi:hypothetical protein GZA08_03370 [Pseudoroseicyclus sp. CLL3-39]|uniref:Transposase n=1 Tax=Pseudoroseicyclus tamaricis TaxID=2705421 RepID=A0A6B2K118_9RHOB|nr:hypothetical protein [Pseudoroseicyclus tamaricis]